MSHFKRRRRDHLNPEQGPEALSHEAVQARRRSIYLLPNAFTTAALFGGFYAIVQAMNKHFDYAAIAIFCSIVLDGMDGRIARLTNTQSAFGEQYDSLSDMVSFGVAPALVMYEWVLKDLGRWGWLAAFLYCAGAALRLARFNANIGVIDKRYFQGMPSPAAAALIAGFVWLVTDNQMQIRHGQAWVAWGLTVYAGLTMVSNARFYSGKALDPRFKVPFSMMLVLLLVFVFIASDAPIYLFLIFVVYSLSGYVMWAWQWLKDGKQQGSDGNDLLENGESTSIPIAETPENNVNSATRRAATQTPHLPND